METLSIVKFTPFDKMKETGEYDDIEKLTQQISNVSKTARKIESNIVHEGGFGDMYAMEWRGGMSKGYSVGYMYQILKHRRKKRWS